MKTMPPKDPQSTLDYAVDWTAWLAGDTIDHSIWIVPDGLNRVSEAKTGTVATLWLSGGMLGETYEVANRIVTTGGRTVVRTFSVRIEQR